MTLQDARRLGHRRVRRHMWPPGAYLEFIGPYEVGTALPPLATAYHTAVVQFHDWMPFGRLFWRLPWEDYEGLELHGED